MSTEDSDGAVPDAATPPSGAFDLPRDNEAALVTDANIDLERAILPTKVSAPVAWLLIVLFCILLAAVPLIQITLEMTGQHRAQLGDLFHRRPTRESLHSYEEDVARNSVFKQAVQPYMQLAITSATGAGNGNVYCGLDGVLFYKPGMRFVTDRGILDPARLRARKKHFVDAGDRAAEPDPRPAILAFDAACRAAGAHLVLVPVPDKIVFMSDAAGFPDGVRSGRESAAIMTNADFPKLVTELRSAGVDVYDPQARDSFPPGSPRFLKQDTHWTPEWMEWVAQGLAHYIRVSGALPVGPVVRHRTEEVAIRKSGDLVTMLDLPPGQTLFPPLEVTVKRTLYADTGALWEPQTSADVLLLGDSFANIYTAAKMGWGEAAGFAPALARHFDRAMDVIAINGAGASGTRRELARRPEGLAGKRVVIWEFAVRELTEGSWETIAIPTAPASRPSPSSDSSLVVEATLEAISKAPEPFTVPYPDCLMFTMLHVDRVLEGKYSDEQILAVMWAMKNNVSLPAAKYKPGYRFRAHLIPLRQADESVRTGQRVDDIADYKHRPYFVTEEHGL